MRQGLTAARENLGGFLKAKRKDSAQERVDGPATMATSSSALIAIGKAWESIQRMKDGDEIEVSVGLDVGFRQGDDEFEEGVFACLRVDDEGIDLSVLSSRLRRSER